MLKVYVVTDADLGIGIDLAKVLYMRFGGVFYFTTRDAAKGREAVAAISTQGQKILYHQLDISDRQSILKFRDHIQQNYDGINMLVHNVAIGNGIQVCDSYESVKKVLDDYYYNYVAVKELLFPLLKNSSKVVYVTKQGDLSCVRNQYWFERLSMKHLRENDVNDFLEWYLSSVKNGTFNSSDIVEEGTMAPFRVAYLALTIFVTLQRKELQSRGIGVEFMHPRFTYIKVRPNIES